MSAAGMALVALGGAAGSVLRALAAAAWPADPAAGAVPWATLAVNGLGAFALGVLVGVAPASAGVRLLLGTGLCGGFTTFSTVAVEGVGLAAAGRPARALAYTLGSLTLGVVAAALGVALGAALRAAVARRAA